MDASIRLATVADLKAMYELSSTVHAQSYSTFIAPDNYERFLAFYRYSPERQEAFVAHRQSGFRDGSLEAYVVYHEGELVAFKQSRRLQSGIVCGGGLFVRPDMQGMGIGRALLLHWIDAMPSGTTLQLSVLEKNVKARKLYEKFDFIQTGQAERQYFGEKLDVLQRKKD